eukprot:6050089-Pleurochrysis_carterae.AAC.2
MQVVGDALNVRTPPMASSTRPPGVDSAVLPLPLPAPPPSLPPLPPSSPGSITERSCSTPCPGRVESSTRTTSTQRPSVCRTAMSRSALDVGTLEAKRTGSMMTSTRLFDSSTKYSVLGISADTSSTFVTPKRGSLRPRI